MKQKLTSAMALLLLAAIPAAAAAKEQDRLERLQRERQKLERETDAIDRAKIGIRISELLIEEIGESVRDGNFDEMEAQLDAYNETIQNAHQSLIDSGRDAAKKPSGFKELEIALRKHARRFDELARMLTLQRRVPLEQSRDFATDIRDKLLKALFP
jgi:hypothetical protein